MRIFLISNMYPSKKYPDYGIFVKNFENALKERGVIFSKIAVIKEKSFGAYQKLKIYIKHYLDILKKYRNKGFDIIYIHYLSHNAPIFLLLLSFFSKRTPIVVNVHGSDVIKYNKGFYKFASTYLLKRTDLIVVPSAYFKDIITEYFPFFNSENIYINPSGGVNLEVFYPMEISKSTEKLEIGFVSRIDEGKGWDSFLEVVKRLKDDIAIKATIAGDGAQVDSMLTMIEQNELTSHINYLGSVKQDALRKIYNTIDLFIFSSTRKAESLGLVGLESMACGTPIIASDMAGPKTYVIDNVNSFLVTPGSISDIVNCIKKYKKLSQQQQHNLSNRAIDTARNYDSNLTADNLYKKLEELNKQCSNGKKSIS